MAEAYVIDGVRTVFGKTGGAISSVRPDDLGAAVLAELVRRNPALDPSLIDDVFWGATNQAGDDSRNVARISAILAGLPLEVGGATVNRLCGSGLEAVMSGARAIKSGDLEVCLVGGAESMSRAPFVLPRAESPYQRTQELWDSRLGWRSVNPVWRERWGARSLIECAELTAEKYGVTREEQDACALSSHMRATKAWDEGRYDDIAISVGDFGLKRDETVRPEATAQSLGRLKPLLGPGTTVTPGNSAPMNDGAAGMLLVSEAAAHRSGLQPLARVVGGATIGVHPDGLDAPIPATRKLMERLGWETASLDAVEMTEAFASQVVACTRELKLEPEIVNAWGGAMAIGHPLAASGARLLSTLIHRLRVSGGRRGIATMCIGIGQGITVALELC